MRVIDGTNNQQLGVMATSDAVRKARTMGLDLVEVSPNAVPPVCRIVDFGKFRYDIAKQEKDRKHSTAGKVKEIKFRVNISQHDYETKMRHAEEFLEKGYKIKVHLQFRGREMAHQDLGMKLMLRVKGDLVDMGHVDVDPKIVGKAISMMVSPIPAAKRKRKFLSEGAAYEEEENAAPEPGLANRIPLPDDLEDEK